MPLLTFQIITPEKTQISNNVRHIVLPGACGQLGIMPGHVSQVVLLSKGRVRWDIDGGKQQFSVLIDGGISLIGPSRVLVVAMSMMEDSAKRLSN